MTVVVTGVSGFVGRWLADVLVSAGLRVVGIDLAARIRGTEYEHYECNILERDRLIAVLTHARPDAVVHLAARTDLRETRDIRGYSANTEGTRNVLMAASAAGTVKRLVVTSSQLVCRVGVVPKNELEYCPDTLYGRSKVLTEEITRSWESGEIEWCLVRPTTVWGPYMSPHYQSMLRHIRNGTYFHCGHAALRKSYAYARNIAFQYHQLIRAPRESIAGRTFYLADYEPLSLRAYADAIAGEMGARKIPTLPIGMARLLAWCGDGLNRLGWRSFPFNSFRLRNIITEYVFDLTATASVCGALPVDWRQGVRETVRWFSNECQ